MPLSIPSSESFLICSMASSIVLHPDWQGEAFTNNLASTCTRLRRDVLLYIHLAFIQMAFNNKINHQKYNSSTWRRDTWNPSPPTETHAHSHTQQNSPPDAVLISQGSVFPSETAIGEGCFGGRLNFMARHKHHRHFDAIQSRYKAFHSAKSLKRETQRRLRSAPFICQSVSAIDRGTPRIHWLTRKHRLLKDFFHFFGFFFFRMQ